MNLNHYRGKKFLKNARFFFFFLLFLTFPFLSAQAYWVWSPEEGKFVNTEGAAQDAAEEMYDHALKLYKDKEYKESAEVLENILKRFPNSRIASEAQYRMGIVFEESGDLVKAFRAYKRLLDTYPQTERQNEVIERQFKIGNAFLAGKKGKLMGLEILPSLPKAVEVFESIARHAPFGEYGDQAQFQLGIAYKRWNRFDQAVEAFQKLIDDYPGSKLVPEAKFQLAEASYLRSSAAFRDQRALEDASRQVDRFLAAYPSNEGSEQAARIRQAIDEKNAEKNYRIGLYYEKQNYVNSALIYYSDLLKNASHTVWGQKAAERMKALDKPADYLSGEQKGIEQALQVSEAKLNSLNKKDPDYGTVKREVEKLKERRKSLEKTKEDSLNRRESDLKRRQGELKQKYKKLEDKRKLLKKNPSDDLKKALDRWTASLDEERDALEAEKLQLKEWRKVLGVSDQPFYTSWVPFMGDSLTEVEKIQRMGAKDLYSIAREKKNLLNEKELLYKQRGEVGILLNQGGASTTSSFTENAEEEINKLGNKDLEEKYTSLKALQEQMNSLDKEIQAAPVSQASKTSLWKSMTGKAQKVAGSSASIINQSFDKSMSVISPFGHSKAPLEEMPLQDLLARRMHVQEKIATQKNLIDILNQSFNDQLAFEEQKRLRASLASHDKIDPMELRKTIKRTEKEIRAAYEEIQDRDKNKRKLIKQLEKVLSGKDEDDSSAEKVGRAVKETPSGVVWFMRSFLFGIPDYEKKLTKSAENMSPFADETRKQQAAELKEQIENENLIIAARDKQVRQLSKELEVMRAKASLAGGYKFRSSFVKIPYDIIGEAVENANKILPKKNREELVLAKLDEETRELEAHKVELKKINQLIESKSEFSQINDKQVEPNSEEISESKETNPKQESEFEKLLLERQKMEELYSQGIENFERDWKAAGGNASILNPRVISQTSAPPENSAKLNRELTTIQNDLAKLVEKEHKLESKELAILEKRVESIDRIMAKVNSKAVSQDLLNEKSRLEERINQIDLRKDFLGREREKFSAGKGV